MAVQRTSMELIEDFLAQKRIAIVGMSREAKSMSEMVFKELSKRGYEVVPVKREGAGSDGAQVLCAGTRHPTSRRRSFADDLTRGHGIRGEGLRGMRNKARVDASGRWPGIG